MFPSSVDRARRLDAMKREDGQVVTFYSYKGGTGRSMSLANVAWILAANGKRVLVIDWDLEAPGLHRYFHPFLMDPELSWSEGVIDFVWQFADSALDPATEGRRADRTDGSLPEDDLSRFALSLDYGFGDGVLELIPAGRQGASYSERVNTFNWANFYDRLGGGALIEANRRRLKQLYDYVLVDSRTGVSDTSGICTVDLPDSLVACFMCNTQSIAGASAVVESVTELRRSRPLEVFPVLMRVELSEQEKLAASRRFARERFERFLPDGNGGPDAQPRFRDYWSRAEVLYYPYFSYEEILSPFADDPASSNTLLRGMWTLAGLVSGETLVLPEIGPREREIWKRRYAREPVEQVAGSPESQYPESLYHPDLATLYSEVRSAMRAWKRLDRPRFMLLPSERLKELRYARNVLEALQQDPDFETYHAESLSYERRIGSRATLLRRVGGLFLAGAGVLMVGGLVGFLIQFQVLVGMTPLVVLGVALLTLGLSDSMVRRISLLLSSELPHVVSRAIRKVGSERRTVE